MFKFRKTANNSYIDLYGRKYFYYYKSYTWISGIYQVLLHIGSCIRSYGNLRKIGIWKGYGIDEKDMLCINFYRNNRIHGVQVKF